MRRKLSTRIEYKFEEQENLSEFNVAINLKTNKKIKDIKIIEHKKKKKTVDASTKLF